MNIRQLITAGAIAAAAYNGANAAPLLFFGEDLGNGDGQPPAAHPNASAAQAAFLSKLAGVQTETFESFPTDTPAPLSLNFPGVTATLNGSGSVQTGWHPLGRFPISGENWWNSSSSFSIEFDNPVAAFGFYGVDIGDFKGQITMTFVGGETETIHLNHTVNAPGGGIIYFGYINPEKTFQHVTFGNTAPGVDVFAFDDMTVGRPEQIRLPEAASGLILLGSGLLGLQFFRRAIRR